MTTSSLYDSAITLTKSTSDTDVLGIVAIVIGICATITLFATFLNKNNEGKFSGILGIIYDTLTFKKFWLKPMIKAFYLILAIYTTIHPFGYISIKEEGWKIWLETLIVGHIVLRMAFEAGMMFVGIYENGKEMNEKLPKGPRPQGQPRPMAQQPVQQPVQRPVQQPVQQVVQQPVQQAPVQNVQNPVQPQ